MSTSVKEIAALAKWDNFAKDTGATSTHGQCHNALTWLAVQIKKANLPTYNIWLCVGSFATHDHSWIQVEDIDTETHTIIDMTVDQFGNFPMPYIGPMSPGYVIYDSVLLSDEENLQNFIETLG